MIRTCRDGDDSVGDFLAQIGLSGFLHLEENHGRNFFGGLYNIMLGMSTKPLIQTRSGIEKDTHEFLGLALELDLDVRLPSLVGDLEGEVLDVGLDFNISELATD